MKQKFLLFSAALCIIASCSKDDGTSSSSSSATSFNGDKISFENATSRASVATITTLEDDDIGFKVYATTASDNSTWYIDGSNNYVYSSAWGWTDTDNEPLWPSDTSEYDMSFLAIYPAAPTGSTLTATAPNLSAAIVVPSPSGQDDIMTAVASTSAKPADGHITLYFKHILSRLGFSIKAGDGVTVELQCIKMSSVGNSGSYDVATESWTEAPDTFENDYTYIDLAGETHATFLGATDDDTSELKSTLAGSTDDYLMLMPQSGAPAWDPYDWADGDTADDMEGAFIELIYRYSSDEEENCIGYDDISDHPDYNTVDDASLESTPLYIRVAYPLDASWEKGYSYDYQISLGTLDSSNGYLIDEYYYDKYGNPTKFTVNSELTTGDPVSSNVIHFEVKVYSGWTTDSSLATL
ncbi:MAG: fimbrillin family protein [Rikenellaceae bacterium]